MGATNAVMCRVYLALRWTKEGAPCFVHFVSLRKDDRTFKQRKMCFSGEPECTLKWQYVDEAGEPQRGSQNCSCTSQHAATGATHVGSQMP
eukprot:2707434-Amphidinium_carterae.1